jgi:hypothetical protein
MWIGPVTKVKVRSFTGPARTIPGLWQHVKVGQDGNLFNGVSSAKGVDGL